MYTTQRLNNRIFASSLKLASGAVLLTVVATLLAPFLWMSLPHRSASSTTATVETAVLGTSIAEAFFGDAPKAETSAIVDKKIDFVSSRDAYPASLAVVQKHADAITSTAADKGVPADVAIGVALLENGGSETAKSPAGALGVYQLMPYTAKNLGLTVNSKVDDRKDPNKSIEAGISYLKSNYDRFGDWGLATWAYHAGEGNVAKALKIYAKENDGIDLPGVENSAALRSYVESHGITVYKLLSDPAVEQFTDKLHDDTAAYPYKVVATAALFRAAQSK